MLVGFAVIALRAVWNASDSWKGRAIAALGLFIPALFGYVIPVGTPGVLPLSFALLTLATVLGLPIFAVFGGLALLLFWSSGTPVASVPGGDVPPGCVSVAAVHSAVHAGRIFHGARRRNETPAARLHGAL